MLQQLTVENYTLIHHLSIRFEPGFTVITGETGAGKSIIIGALSLILGQRADSNILLDNSIKCIIEGVFFGKDYNLEPFFKANDLDYDDTIILRREIAPSGKSRAFINDTPVNLNLIRELGEKLMDIHSQHAILALNSPEFQLNIADEYAGNSQILQQHRSEFNVLQAMKGQLQNLKQQEIKARKDQDYYNFLLNELVNARLQPDEKDELENELEIQTHAEEIKTNLQQANYLFNQREDNLLQGMAETVAILKKVSNFHTGGEKLFQRLESVWIELKDIVQEIIRLEESIVYDPEKLEHLNQRLNLIYQLEQKHRVTGTDELMRIIIGLQDKLNNIVSLEEQIKLLSLQINGKQTRLSELDKKLSFERQEVLQPVSEELTLLVKQLGMPDAQVCLKLEKLNEPGFNGSDRIRVLFNANKGGTLKEVSSIASGGELSRLMLSVKYLLSRKKKLPTLIFDEIDVGISGEIAAKMGALMQSMAGLMQLITITHLPQIAGKAANHLLVYKESGDHSTRSNIRALEHDDRIMEIAKMLSGENVSEISIMKAKELMEYQIKKK